MAKVALLIGVSEYEAGLSPLPASRKDVEAMSRVLKHPEMGNFAEVKQLINPDPLVMQEAIETLFSNRQRDDLVLLFFSGHGVRDSKGKLYFATRSTRQTSPTELVKSTAVSASFVHDIMSYSRSKHQVVILDCCFSGAFAEGWSAKDDGSVDVKTQLGGEGRVVLTSSTSTEYSFQQEGFELSTYTRYIVEGIETGAADRDNDGLISVDELHNYAKKKVQEATSKMTPEIYAARGFRIFLAKARISDPRLRYRREVEYFASRGEISSVGRRLLDVRRDEWGLSQADADAIEVGVLKFYREYQVKLQQYEQFLSEAVQRKYPLSPQDRSELRRLQEFWKLKDEDVASIEARIAPQIRPAKPPDPIPSLPQAPNNPSYKVSPPTQVSQPVVALSPAQPENNVPTNEGCARLFGCLVSVVFSVVFFISLVGIILDGNNVFNTATPPTATPPTATPPTATPPTATPPTATPPTATPPTSTPPTSTPPTPTSQCKQEPKSARVQGLQLTVQKVCKESEIIPTLPKKLRIWMKVTNGTSEDLELDLYKNFVITDNFGNQYEANIFDKSWLGQVLSGQEIVGSVILEQPVDEKASTITVTFTRVWFAGSPKDIKNPIFDESIAVKGVPIP